MRESLISVDCFFQCTSISMHFHANRNLSVFISFSFFSLFLSIALCHSQSNDQQNWFFQRNELHCFMHSVSQSVSQSIDEDSIVFFFSSIKIANFIEMTLLAAFIDFAIFITIKFVDSNNERVDSQKQSFIVFSSEIETLSISLDHNR